MSCALRWQEHASRMRLIQSSKEADIQNVELPTWYVMESKGGEDWLKPSHPLNEERELGSWMDKVCQGMFLGWKMAYDRYRGNVRQLESTTRNLDGALRSAYNDRQLLMKFRSQSQRLQNEMAGDIERLQDQLTEADGEVDQVRSNLITLTRQAYDDREKYDLSMKTSEARIKELERKLGASCF